MSKSRSWLVNPDVRKYDEGKVFEELVLPARGRASAKLLIGRREWLALPVLGVDCISAKIDTGAYTSSLHAEGVDVFGREGNLRVRFTTHNHHGERIACEADVLQQKRVRSSTGRARKRVFIQTTLRTAGGLEWRVRLSLADRSVMKCPMLLGRRALAGRFVVDSQTAHVFGALHELRGVKPRRKG